MFSGFELSNDNDLNPHMIMQAINEEMFAKHYNINNSDIIKLVYFAPAKALKITIVRPIPSGALGETDVYGALQHAPLVGLTLNM